MIWVFHILQDFSSLGFGCGWVLFLADWPLGSGCAVVGFGKAT